MSADGGSADAEHWEELQRLFDRFEHSTPDERETQLAAACSDPAVRARALRLLSAADSVAAAGNRAADSSVDEFIGPYRLVRQIGAGGIGAVYLAEKLVDGVALRAALKVLAPHSVDRAFVERFHREQENLAALDHPNITRLQDAGWGQKGQPYLVMEYVDGAHLDDYCDGLGLGIVARLEFFLQICEAVSSAHRNLIVHLDLKPSNILITATGTVKLLDFGTSKLIRPDADATSTVMATPAYASPEQLLNKPVSTASDVYGLGAVLFELLTGRAPFGMVSAGVRIEMALREVEPDSIVKAVTAEAAARRGSSLPRLRQVLRGDLAAIVAACLRSLPHDRYSSIEALADEVRRYLSSNPVLARRQTASYKAGKFIRRNRAAVAVTAGVAFTIATSASFAWLQQQHALREAERSVRMQTFMFSLFKMANPNFTAKPLATVPEFLRAGLDRLPEYIHDPADLRVAQLALAESLYESGDFAGARQALAKIIDAAARAHAPADKAEAEAFAGAVEYQDGNITAGRALTADALTLAQGNPVSPRVFVLTELFFAYNADNNGFYTDANLAMLRSAVTESRARHLSMRDTALALYYLASDLYQRGRGTEAKPIFQQLLPLYEGDPLALCSRSDVYGWLAWITNTEGDSAASLPLFRQAYDGAVACSGTESRGALDQLTYWGDALIRVGRADEAVSMLEKGLPVWRRVMGNSTDTVEIFYYLARGYNAMTRYEDAERVAREMLARIDGKLEPRDRTVGLAHLALGRALVGQHRFTDALPHAAAAVDLLVASAATPYGREIGVEATQLARDVAAGLH